jgi:hypothetical protein
LLPLLVSGVFDFLLLIATIVVAVTVGKPLSMLSCEVLPANATTAVTFVTVTSSAAQDSGLAYRSILSKAVDYFAFVTVDQPHCYEIKAIWGLSIALCVLFAFSTLVCVGLWHRIKNMYGPSAPKDIEG